MRVLVVEDEPDLRSVLARSLREDGYAVDTAADGADGLWKTRNAPYDAVILDLMLPRMDGLAVLAEIRRAKLSVPVLVLTARDALRDRVRGLDDGADDYMTKPFELPELAARLRALIRRASGKPSARIELGEEVVLDTAAKLVTRAGEPVPLTAREYAVLELLAVHRGELVTRTAIYEHIFDENEDSLSNLVDVHVSNVRRKLGKDLIKTRRGQGYVIETPPGADGA